MVLKNISASYAYVTLVVSTAIFYKADYLKALQICGD